MFLQFSLNQRLVIPSDSDSDSDEDEDENYYFFCLLQDASLDHPFDNWRGIPTRLNNIPHPREIRKCFYEDVLQATQRAVNDGRTRLKSTTAQAAVTTENVCAMIFVIVAGGYLGEVFKLELFLPENCPKLICVMKRLRSYGDDLFDERTTSSSSSHRRSYSSKTENGRKGSSTLSGYDRNVDDDRDRDRDWDRGRPLRKRVDHDSDGFDRRKGFDRFSVSISSPRSGGYGGDRDRDRDRDRIHRSESFSGTRREFPKGFRSERDRPRREESSWRRFGRIKDFDEDLRSPSDSKGSRERLRSPSQSLKDAKSPSWSRDVKSPTWSKESGGGERSKSVEVKKSEEVGAESGNNSEMEEGELEPEPVAQQEPKPDLVQDNGDKIVSDGKGDNRDKKSLAEEVKEKDGEKMVVDKCVSDGKVETHIESLEKTENSTSSGDTDVAKEIEKLCHSTDNSNASDGSSGTKEEEVATASNGNAHEEDASANHLECLPASDRKHIGEGNEGDSEKGISEKVLLPEEEKKQEERKQEKPLNLDNGMEGSSLPESSIGFVEEMNLLKPELTLIHLKDKGKGLAFSPSNDTSFIDVIQPVERDLIACKEDAMEGPSNRGFRLFLGPSLMTEKTNVAPVTENDDEKLKLEPLELSLGLPNVSLPLASQNSAPNVTLYAASQDMSRACGSPPRGRSVQSLATSFRTGSDGFTASVSFSGSQFVHNPSCSLTQNSLDNFEHSVGSHPIFLGVDWSQPMNEPKLNEASSYQNAMPNGNGSIHRLQSLQGTFSGQGVQGQQHLKALEESSGMPSGLARSLSLQRQLPGVKVRNQDNARSPAHSVGSRETRSEFGQDKKQVLREESGGKHFRDNGQREMEQVLANGMAFVERIISIIVSEPVQVVARRFYEMNEQSIAALKDGACEFIVKEDKHGRKLLAFQDALQGRSDLTLDTLLKSHRTQLEILVAMKTGLQDVLKRADKISSTDLAEIFLNLKCRNLDCRSILPVDECDCKICSQKIGFCSTCMCLVCLKFDMASNTCSWVGCDVCLHWCHTDCALRGSYIRSGRGAQGTTEMQFHCVACSHPSEMFGFVKEVFKTCAKEWKMEILQKELQYVKRIFSASTDIRGKLLHDVAEKMLVQMERGCSLPEVCDHILRFLSESDSLYGNTVASSGKELQSLKSKGEVSNAVAMPNQESNWLNAVSAEKTPLMENASGAIPDGEGSRVGKRSWDSELRMSMEKKPVMDELESIIKIKLAEAKMFQTRADDARREADGLRRIAVAKNEKIEEEYTNRITKLRLAETEERRRQKLEELQVLDRSHREYYNMKTRMEADIKDLLLKMEVTKRNLSM
ncbi:Oberon, PHD finger domain [Dillenia turbinata]|uniref:Oberon, PHD finger domain n=1 Tax=Dillenia turbinata TaxID=194707 RepID=A0AAN8Z3Y4_9MAGN